MTARNLLSQTWSDFTGLKLYAVSNDQYVMEEISIDQETEKETTSTFTFDGAFALVEYLICDLSGLIDEHLHRTQNDFIREVKQSPLVAEAILSWALGESSLDQTLSRIKVQDEKLPERFEEWRDEVILVCAATFEGALVKEAAGKDFNFTEEMHAKAYALRILLHKKETRS